MFKTTRSSLKTHSSYSCSYADRATLHCSSFISHNLMMTLLTWTFCPFSFTYFLFPLFFFFFFFCSSNFFNSVSGSAEWCLSVPSNSILEDLEYYHFIAFLARNNDLLMCNWHSTQHNICTAHYIAQNSRAQFSTANNSKSKQHHNAAYLILSSSVHLQHVIFFKTDFLYICKKWKDNIILFLRILPIRTEWCLISSWSKARSTVYSTV